MLTQQKNTFRAKSVAVKSIAAAALLFAATPAIAQVTTTAYNVRFSKSLTETQTGVEKIYAMFEKKAEKACRAGKAVDDKGYTMSKSECVEDMVAQFVESSDLAPVRAYHLAKLEEAQ